MHKIRKHQSGKDILRIVEWLRNSIKKSKDEKAKVDGTSSTLVGEGSSNTKKIDVGNVLSIGSNAVGVGLDLLGAKKAEVGNPGLDTTLDTASEIAKNFGVWGQVGAAALQGFKHLNNYAGKTANSLITEGADVIGYDLGVSDTAGKKFSLLNSGKKLRNANKQNFITDVHNIAKADITYQHRQNQLNASNSISNVVGRNQIALFGGISPNIVSAKSGTSISRRDLKIIKAKVGAKIKKLQSGEPVKTLEIQPVEEAKPQNVIPEGALHSRLNNYEGDLGEQVTDKGIPVITYEEGNKILQHAEIEHSEIIFTKEISSKLEDMYKEYQNADDSRKKELELECGKLLTVEILENTVDNVGILNTV